MNNEIMINRRKIFFRADAGLEIGYGHFIRTLALAEDGSIKRHWAEYENSRSQDLPKEYHDTGIFYWYKMQEWLKGNVKLGAIIVEETAVQDIDNETDWKLAEMKYKLMNQ